METNPNAASTGKAKKQSTIPKKDNDLHAVALAVGRNWEKAQGLTLAWMPLGDFKACVEEYGGALSTKNETGGQRSPVTLQLKTADRDIDSALKHLKGYLAEKYGEEGAKAYYAKFGIVHYKYGYILPKERMNRLQALKMVVPALKAEGLEGKKYGAQYWEPLVAAYQRQMDETMALDGAIAKEVGHKEHCKQRIRLALNCIVLLLKANYPDSYASVLREWGFQKEKY